jgi:hypothetical protein
MNLRNTIKEGSRHNHTKAMVFFFFFGHYHQREELKIEYFMVNDSLTL